MTQEKIKKVREAINVLSSLTDEEWEELKECNNKFQTLKDEEEVNKVEIKVAELLKRIGFPCHVKGYTYLISTIFWVLDNNNEFSVNKELYPYITKQFNATPSRVERAIRHSIEVAWERGDKKMHEKIFGSSSNLNNYRPTVHEVVCCLTEYVKLYLI